MILNLFFFCLVKNYWKLSFALGVNLKNLADFCKSEAKSSFRLRKDGVSLRNFLIGIKDLRKWGKNVSSSHVKQEKIAESVYEIKK